MKKITPIIISLCLLTACSSGGEVSSVSSVTSSLSESSSKYIMSSSTVSDSSLSSEISTSSSEVDSSSSVSSSSEAMTVKYEVVTKEDKSIAGESRYVCRVIVDPNITESEVTYVSYKVSKLTMDKNIVWFYSSQKAVDEGPYDVAMVEIIKGQGPTITMKEKSASLSNDDAPIVEKIKKEINDTDMTVENTVKERIDIFNIDFSESSVEALTISRVQLNKVMNVVKDYENIEECFIMFTRGSEKLLYGISYKIGEDKAMFVNKVVEENKTFSVDKDYFLDLDSGEVLLPRDKPSSSSSQSSSEGKVTWYKEGMYKVGKDIEAGEYVIRSTSATTASCYMTVKKDSTGESGSTITSDIFDTFMFITVKDGQYLEVNRGEFAKADVITVTKSENGIYGEGMYRIGTDLPAGEYKIKANGGKSSCYMTVTSDSTGERGTTVTSDIFDTEKYITVKDGQYLKVSRGIIT